MNIRNYLIDVFGRKEIKRKKKKQIELKILKKNYKYLNLGYILRMLIKKF